MSRYNSRYGPPPGIGLPILIALVLFVGFWNVLAGAVVFALAVVAVLAIREHGEPGQTVLPPPPDSQSTEKREGGSP